MSTQGKSMASKAMDEAVELAIEERSPYPDRSAFIDADTPDTAKEISLAADEGYAIVLVSGDGSKRILQPQEVAG
ncbi:MAG: hypothetical protein ACTHNY_04695 [Solirubrobacterales bacterium]